MSTHRTWPFLRLLGALFVALVLVAVPSPSQALERLTVEKSSPVSRSRSRMEPSVASRAWQVRSRIWCSIISNSKVETAAALMALSTAKPSVLHLISCSARTRSLMSRVTT